MSLLPVHRQPSALLPDFDDLWNAFGAPLAVRASMFGPHLLRVEESFEDGQYVVRVEMPGIDPGKDVEVSVHNGHLTIKAERTEKKEEKRYSEFRYGSFERTVALPAGALEESIDARYANGVLTVSVPMKEQTEALTRKVEVKSGE
ncbi:Hsp20/alpha crystallin family protein [Nocardia crassostreae]|uniref:Hsp20/alpha crystallin family protein n=1 Tax=Nocardia crassostreae TaxID=53428 RepID=UPI00083032C2|nr:Hsp20/alpha crystallin family protein [Nocardia crassostreae]